MDTTLKKVLWVIDRGDSFVIEFDYRAANGERSRRVVSPCQVFYKRFLGLCLVRGDWRQFHIDKCENVRIGFAFDQLAPVEITASLF